MSSLSYLDSSPSLHSSFLLGPVVAQGPSRFETTELERQGIMAPKMPTRANDSRRNLIVGYEEGDDEEPLEASWVLSKRVQDDDNVDDDGSSGSLTLDDILEESAHSSASTANIKSTKSSRPKSSLHRSSRRSKNNESRHNNSALSLENSWGMDSSKTINHDDEDDFDDDDDDSTVTSISYASASSFPILGDSFAKLKSPTAKCVV